MKRSFVVLALVFVVPGSIFSTFACPFCNIHNHLAPSVRGATDVFVGKVLTAVDEKTATVRVQEVLRGTFVVGQAKKMPMWEPKEDVGQSLVFCYRDPRIDGIRSPNFKKVLPLDYKGEIEFLLRLTEPPKPGPNRPAGKGGFFDDEGAPDPPEPPMKPEEMPPGWRVHPQAGILAGLGRLNPQWRTIRDLDEAIVRACGISKESRTCGALYLLARSAFPSERIVSAIRQARKPGKRGRTAPYADYRSACLVQALMLRRTETGRAFVMAEASRWLATPSTETDWSSLRWATPPAWWLRVLLAAPGGGFQAVRFSPLRVPGQPHRELLGQLRKKVLGAYPDLAGASLAEATFALCSSEFAKPAELVALLKTDDQRDRFALGMAWYGCNEANAWARDRAQAALDIALKAARMSELRAFLQKRIARLKEKGF